MIRQFCASMVLLGCAANAFAETSVYPQVQLAGVPAEIMAIAQIAFGQVCEFDGEAGPDQRYNRHDLIYKDEGDAPDQAAKKATLHELFCLSGAYNIVTVYLITKDDEGTLPLQFAAPAFRTIYEDDDSEKGVLRIDIQGFTTLNMLANAEFDASTGTMNHFSKWRGVGDASSSGRWSFLGGEFVLTHFEVDASYDAELNPTVIYDAAPETP